MQNPGKDEKHPIKEEGQSRKRAIELERSKCKTSKERFARIAISGSEGGDDAIKVDKSKQSTTVRLKHIDDHIAKEGAPRVTKDPLFQSIVENAYMAITWIDRNYKILMVNDSRGRYFEKSASELIGCECYREFKKRQSVCPHCPGKKSMETGRPTQAQTEGVRDDGSCFPVKIQTFPTIDAHGAVNGFIEIIEDLTELTKAQKILQESEEKYRSLFENSVVGIGIASTSGKVLAMNQAITEITGYTFEDFSTMNLVEIYENAEDRTRFLDRLNNDGVVENFEVQLRNKNGEIFWVNLSSKPIIYEGENALLSTILDITERKRADETLRESEDCYRGVVEDTPVLICRFLPSGEITFVNKVYCEYFGKTPQELVGSSFLSLIPEGDRETVMANILSLTVESPTQSHEHPVIFPGGDNRWQHWTNRAIFDAQGKAVMYQSIGEDITERKQAEEKLRQSEKRYREIFNNSSVALWEMDYSDVKDYVDELIEEGHINVTEYISQDPERMQKLLSKIEFLNVNDTTLNLFEADSREDLFNRFDRVITPDSNESFLRCIETYLSGGTVYHSEQSHITLTGKTIKVHLTSTLLAGSETTWKKAMVTIVEITDRKRAEEKLRESEQNYKLLFEDTGTNNSVIDEDGTFFMINEKAAKDLGGKPEEFVGKSIHDFFPKEDIDEYLRRFHEVLELKQAKIYEDCVELPVGKRWLLTTIQPFITKNDKRCVQLISQDITERKTIEEAFLASEKRLSAFFNNSPVGLALWDRDFRYVFLNDVLQEINGPTVEEHIGRKVQDVLPKAAHLIVPLFEKILSTGESLLDMELSGEVPAKPGQITHYIVSYFPILDNDGAVQFIGGVIVDITERKQTEEKLVLATKEWQTTFDATNDAMWIIGSDLRILRSNKTSSEMFDRPQEELIGQCCWQVVHGIKEAIPDECPLRRAQKSLRRETMELPMGENWFQVTVDPILDETGAYFGAVHIITDITERKRAQEALLVRSALERMVAEISTSFINLPIENVDDGIVKALEQIGRFVGADRSYVFRLNEDLTAADNTHEWCSEGIEAQIGNLQGIPVEAELPWFMAFMRRGEIFNIPSVADLPPEAISEREHFKVQDIQSLVVLPMISRGTLVGFIGFDAVRTCCSWSEDTVLLLQMVGNIVMNAVQRRQAEEELRTSEEKHRTLYENMVQGAFYQRADGMVVDANPAVLDMFGLTRNQFLGRTSMDPRWKVIHEDGSDLPGEHHPSMVALRTGQPVRNVVAGFFNPQKEDYVWLNINAIPQFEPGQDKPYQVFVTLHDITERKKMETALKENEQKLRSIIDHSDELFFIHDTEHNLSYISPQSETIFGYTPEEMKVKWTTLTTEAPLNEKGFELTIKAIQIGQKQEPYLLEIKRKDGECRIVEVDESPVKDEKGNVVAISGALRDVTERKKAEDILRREKVTFEAINRLFRESILSESSTDLAQVCLSITEEVTGSQYGSIAEVNREGRFDTLALSNPGWDACAMATLDPAIIQNMEVRGIWAAALYSEDGLIINDPSSHPQSVGVPEGHPPLTSFLGMPFQHKRFRGMIGIANKEGGYTEADRRLVQALVSSFAEVINSKRAEEDLRASEDNFRKMFDESPFGIELLDSDGTIIKMNKQLIEIFGLLEPDQIIGKFSLFEDPNVPKEVKDKMRRGESVHYESQFDFDIVREKKYFGISKSGTIDISYYIVPLFESGNKKIKNYLVQVVDITERKKAEEALRNNEQLLRESQNIAHVGSYSRDIATNKVTWSDELYLILGYDPGEIDPDFEFVCEHIHPEDLERFLNANRKLVEENQEYDVEYRIICKDGAQRYVRSRSVLEFDEAGHPVRNYGALQDITDRKRAEMALREKEVRFRTLFEGMPSGVAVYEAIDEGEDFIFVDFNSTAEKIEGIERSHLLGKRVTDVFPGVKEFGVFDVFQRVWRTGQTEFFPVAFYQDDHDSGSWRENWIYKLPSGNIVAVYNDVTERKKIEDALKERERLLNNVGTIAKIGGWEMDLKEGGRASWTKGTYDIVEINPGEPIPGANEHASWYLPEYRGMIEGKMKDLVETKQPMRFEAKLKTKKGHLKWCQAIGEAIEENGKVVKLRGTFQDITDRKETEEALLESEKKYRSLVESLQEGIWVIDADSNTTYVNRPMADMLAYETEEMLGKHLFHFMDDKGIEICKKNLEDRKQGVKETHEFEFLRKDGVRVCALIETAPITDEKGNYQGAIAGVIDITERKKAQERILKYQSKLKAMASQLSSIQEQQRRQLAVEMHDRVTQKLAMAKLGLETAAASFVDDDAATKIKDIAKQVGQTIEDAYSLMLDLSNPVLYEIGLKAALDTLLQSDFVKHCGIKCKLVTPGQPVDVETDIRVALYQSARELLTNAIKYSKAERIEIRLDRTQEAVVVSVRDDGIGFDPSNIKPPGKKGGFGLFNIRESIGVLDGEFTIETKPGEGTSASVSVPLKVSPV